MDKCLVISPKLRSAVFRLCDMYSVHTGCMSHEERFQFACLEGLKCAYGLSKVLGMTRAEFRQMVDYVMVTEDQIDRNQMN